MTEDLLRAALASEIKAAFCLHELTEPAWRQLADDGILRRWHYEESYWPTILASVMLELLLHGQLEGNAYQKLLDLLDSMDTESLDGQTTTDGDRLRGFEKVHSRAWLRVAKSMTVRQVNAVVSFLDWTDLAVPPDSLAKSRIEYPKWWWGQIQLQS